MLLLRNFPKRIESSVYGKPSILRDPLSRPSALRCASAGCTAIYPGGGRRPCAQTGPRRQALWTLSCLWRIAPRTMPAMRVHRAPVGTPGAAPSLAAPASQQAPAAACQRGGTTGRDHGATCADGRRGYLHCPSEGNRYFVVPGATNQDQSVLACGNPVGTVTGNKAQSTKAYVGVDGCSQCTPPTDPAANGMMVATCTACEAPKKPTGNGVGCAACSDANCRHCKADEKCGTCNGGLSLEGGTCVSAGAIAGISIAAVTVIGGLVGFLCGWFMCRGKA